MVRCPHNHTCAEYKPFHFTASLLPESPPVVRRRHIHPFAVPATAAAHAAAPAPFAAAIAAATASRQPPGGLIRSSAVARLEESLQLDGDAAGNLVHVALAVGGQAATLLGGLLHQAALLQLLHDVANQAACGRGKYVREAGHVDTRARTHFQARKKRLRRSPY